MKVVVLMGSPRKKDSFGICKQIESNICTSIAGSESINSQKIDFEYMFLKDYNIQDCRGCDLCFVANEELCPCDDELSIILGKLLKADGIIFASPVYAYQVPAPFKKLIDRLSYLFHRQALVAKPALIVVTSNGGGHKQVSDYLKMTASGWGCNIVGSLSVISPAYTDGSKYYQKTLDRLKKVTNQFEQSIMTTDVKVPSYYSIFMFNCLRSKTFTSKADYDYWNDKGWLSSEYFYETELSPFKKLFGMTLKQIINIAGTRLKNKVNN